MRSDFERMKVSSFGSYANLALLPRGVSTTTCTSPFSVKGGKLMKFGMAKVLGRCGVRRSAESAELTHKITVVSQMVPQGEVMLEYALRFLAGGIAGVLAFAALGDTLRPKSFAGLFAAAPSIALATLLITLSHKGAPFAAVEGRSMIVGALACRSQLGGVRLAQKIPAVLVVRDRSGSAGGLVRSCAWCIRGRVSTLMIVQFKPSALRQTRWYEFLVRFCARRGDDP